MPFDEGRKRLIDAPPLAMVEAELAHGAPPYSPAGPTITKVWSEIGRHQAERDAARHVRLGLAGDIDVAALAGGGEVLARVGAHALAHAAALAASPAERGFQRRGLETLEISRGAGVGGLADAGLENR